MVFTALTDRIKQAERAEKHLSIVYFLHMNVADISYARMKKKWRNLI